MISGQILERPPRRITTDKTREPPLDKELHARGASFDKIFNGRRSSYHLYHCLLLDL